MARVKFTLIKSRPNADGTFPLKMSVSHLGRTAVISLDIDLEENQWVDKLQRVTNHKRADTINAYLGHLILDAREFILSEKRDGNLHQYKSVTELKNAIQLVIFPKDDETTSNLFMPYLLHYANTRKTKGNKQSYVNTYRKIHSLVDNADTLTFDDIKKSWLDEIDLKMIRIGNSTNGRAFHFRNIRAVMNDAIDNGLTDNYPFRRFKIKKEATRKRSLTVEQLRELFTYPVDDYQQLYLDIFKLSFFLIGINMVDLLHAKTIDRGRLIYTRRKTHKSYSIKIEPEAMDIITKHKGEKYILNILDTRRDYLEFIRKTNQALKSIGIKRSNSLQKIGGKALFPDLTTYWARHSWATIAYSIGISKDVISQALGHSSGLAVTEIYIDRDTALVDQANRAVIDYVLGG